MFKRRRPTIPTIEVQIDPAAARRAKALADQEHALAERQAHEAEIVLGRMAQTNIRNGFSPALEATFKRRLRGT